MPDFWLVAHYVDGLLSLIRRIVKAQELPSLESARKAAIRDEQALSDTVEVAEVTVRTEREMVDRLEHLEMMMMGSIQQPPLQQSYHQPHHQRY